MLRYRAAMGAFDDLLANNRAYAATFDHPGLDSAAHSGVLMITCMDTRILTHEMIGLTFGDANIIRTPGGRVARSTVAGCIVAVQLLGVRRIMVVQHSRCAMASGDDASIIQRIRDASGADASRIRFGACTDQLRTMRTDVDRLRKNKLVAAQATVGGFFYDVDTGRLTQWLE